MSTFNQLLAKKTIDPGNPVKEKTLLGHTVSVFGMTKLFTGLMEDRLKSILQIDLNTVRQWEKALWIAA